jgi:glycerol-3-phosphate O-acyltransferase
LSYIVAGFGQHDADVVFVPVGLAYDRVLEDRVLTAAAIAGTRTFRARPLTILKSALGILWGRMRGTFKGFGTAAVGFGPPISLRAFLAEAPPDPVEALGTRLMTDIARVVPILPVPLVAAAIVAGATREGLLTLAGGMAERLTLQEAVLKLPPQGLADAVNEGLRPLVDRGIVDADLRVLRPELLAFYAASVQQVVDAATPQT